MNDNKNRIKGKASDKSIPAVMKKNPAKLDKIPKESAKVDKSDRARSKRNER